MQPLQLQVTQIGDRELYPLFSEKEKKATRFQVQTVGCMRQSLYADSTRNVTVLCARWAEALS